MTSSVPHLFLETCEQLANNVAMSEKILGSWQESTWAALREKVENCAAGLLKLGVQPGDRVAILSGSSSKWSIADLGILFSQAATVPIYQTTIASDAAYILKDSGCQVIFVEDEAQCDKIAGIQANLPELKQIIVMGKQPGETTEGLIGWDDLISRGKSHLSKIGAIELSGISEGDLATLVYTSGTTGAPKGVCLTHANLLYEANAIEKLGLLHADDVQLLFLPLAHIFAKILQIAWIRTGHKLVYAESIEKVVDNMGEVRPTIMAAVPRIYEKVHAKVISNALSGSFLKAKIAKWALAEEAAVAKREAIGKSEHGFAWGMAKKLVFDKIGIGLNEKFGGRLRFFVSGGAPLSQEIAYFFRHAGVTICEGYGLTETSAATCINLPRDMKLGTVGKAVPGTEIKIEQDGEILIRGPGVFEGYWNKEDETKEALSGDGWFRTGDIGKLDDKGFLKITDRKKDIIVTAGGKNIAPQKLENMLKARCSLVSQVVVHGDKRKFLSAMITIDEAALMPWAKARKLQGDYPTICKSDRVRGLLKHILGQMNKNLASYEQVKKFEVLDQDFTIGDELTPTLKVKRSHCDKKYADIFERMYG